jgi:hypothetical protein
MIAMLNAPVDEKKVNASPLRQPESLRSSETSLNSCCSSQEALTLFVT